MFGLLIGGSFSGEHKLITLGGRNRVIRFQRNGFMMLFMEMGVLLIKVKRILLRKLQLLQVKGNFSDRMNHLLLLFCCV
jgi:hypothetical protein